MARLPGTGRLTKHELVDLFFIENRNRLIEMAAFLDRLDRAPDGADADDFRIAAFRAGLRLVAAGERPRVVALQMLLSDVVCEPLDELDQKSADGAVRRVSQEAK